MPSAPKRTLAIITGLLAVAVIGAGAYIYVSPDHRGLRAALHSDNPATRETAVKNAVLMERLRASATFGSRKAQFKLGRLLASGNLGFTDLDRAARWMRAAADQGYGPAQLYMARFCFLGQGVEKDMAAGAAWVQKAADNKVPNADGLMGMLYLGGIGVDQDFTQALAWLRKSPTPEGDALAASIQKSLDGMSTMPDAEKAAAMTDFATRYKTNIGNSFAKTLDELNSGADKTSDNDGEAEDATAPVTAPAALPAATPAANPATTPSATPAAPPAPAPATAPAAASGNSSDKASDTDNKTDQPNNGEQKDGH